MDLIDFLFFLRTLFWFQNWDAIWFCQCLNNCVDSYFWLSLVGMCQLPVQGLWRDNNLKHMWCVSIFFLYLPDQNLWQKVARPSNLEKIDYEQPVKERNNHKPNHLNPLRGQGCFRPTGSSLKQSIWGAVLFQCAGAYHRTALRMFFILVKKTQTKSTLSSLAPQKPVC